MPPKDKSEFIKPAYKIPFTPDEAALVGSFTAVWGQIDFFLGMAIAALLKTDFFAAETMMQGMTTGPRLNLFQRLIKEHAKRDDTKKIAQKFATQLSPLIEKRNHVMHGMWGYYIADGKHVGTGAFSNKNSKKPIMMEEMLQLFNEAAMQTQNIVTIATHLTDFTWANNPDTPPPAFLFGPGPPPGVAKEAFKPVVVPKA